MLRILPSSAPFLSYKRSETSIPEQNIIHLPRRILRTNALSPPILRSESIVQTLRILPSTTPLPSYKRSGTTHLRFGRHVTYELFPPIHHSASFVQTIRCLPYFASFPSCKRSGTTHLPFGHHVTYDSFPLISYSGSFVQTRHTHTSIGPISPILCSVALVETLCVLLFYASTSSILYGNLSG